MPLDNPNWVEADETYIGGTRKNSRGRMKTSPTQRSLKAMRDRGFTCQVTERWNPFAKVRQDLFGFIDIVALNSDGITGIQSTTSDNAAKRIGKILCEPKAKQWLAAGGLIIVHGWSKKGARNKQKKWQLAEWEIKASTDELQVIKSQQICKTDKTIENIEENS